MCSIWHHLASRGINQLQQDYIIREKPGLNETVTSFTLAVMSRDKTETYAMLQHGTDSYIMQT
jgi:hypothetical protein